MSSGEQNANMGKNSRHNLNEVEYGNILYIDSYLLALPSVTLLLISIVSAMHSIQLAAESVNKLKSCGFEIGQVIKQGSYGHLCCASFKGDLICAKLMPLPMSPPNNYSSRAFNHDRYVSKELKHDHLVNVIDISMVFAGEDQRMAVIFSELAEGGDLQDLLDERKAPLDEVQARTFYRQFGEAVTFMHSKGFQHGNIKCDKIVLDRDRKACKLIAFGFTRNCFPIITSCPLLANSFCPAAAYVAPELLTSHKMTYPQRPDAQMIVDRLPSDVWR